MTAASSPAKRRTRWVIWLSACVIAAIATSHTWLPWLGFSGAQEKAAALTAANRGDRDAAFRNYRRCAILGDRACQKALALSYLHGTGTKADAGKAIGWLVHSYSKGDAESAALIGELLLTGNYGVHPNRRYALQWLRRAYEGGATVAGKLIGDAYRYGWGVTKNWETASYWYTQASLRGCPEADDAMQSLSLLMWPVR